jgi:cytochrome c556
MRHVLRVVLVTVVGGALAAVVGGADPPKDKPKEEPKLPTKKEVMAAKLKLTQQVLEGIAVNDFNKVDTAADELTRLSRATAFLDAYKGEEYRFQMTTFKKAVTAVGMKAKDKNMDGVMVAYNDLTLSCVKCHQGMRDNKYDARLVPPGPVRGE